VSPIKWLPTVLTSVAGEPNGYARAQANLSNCPVVCTRDYELQRADVPANEWDTTETERLCLVLQAGLTT